MADDDDDLICPITLETFRDPVRADDGRLYERTAITKWINEHGTSPFTRQASDVNRLQPADEIRKKVDQRRKLSGEHKRQPQGVRLPPIRPSRNVNVNPTPRRVRRGPTRIYGRRSRSVLNALDRCCDFISETSEKCFMFVFRVDL